MLHQNEARSHPMNAFLISMNQSKYTVTSLDKKKNSHAGFLGYVWTEAESVKK